MGEKAVCLPDSNRVAPDDATTDKAPADVFPGEARWMELEEKVQSIFSIWKTGMQKKNPSNPYAMLKVD